MAQLSSEYLGLTLKNPIIVSSSGLTATVNKIIEAEKAGAAAVVLKSVFEEQINYEASSYQNISKESPESFDYLQGYVTANNLDNYLKLIAEAKEKTSIPVIASIHCYSDKKWIDFAQLFEEAGADALELNIYMQPESRNTTGADIEKQYINLVKKVVKKTKIPVAVKLSNQFTNLINMSDRLASVGAKGVVLFNRFYEPDINIEKLEMNSFEVFSNPSDLRFALRWGAIIADKVPDLSIASSTGVHNAEGVIKMILAGADAVQLCSVLYQKGFGEIQKMLDEIETWMAHRGFETLKSIRGLMSYKSVPNPEIYERSQFMKYFSNFE